MIKSVDKIAPYEYDRYFAPDIDVIKQEILKGDLALPGHSQ